jgi:hypothetical protein
MVDEVHQSPVLDNSVLEKQEVQQEGVDGGYGWVNVVCMLLLTAHTWGVNGVSRPACSFLSSDMSLLTTS